MVHRHHQAVLPLVELSVLQRDLEIRTDQLHGTDAAEAHDDLGLHQRPLPPQEAAARVLLRIHRIAVLRRAALDGIGDVDAAPVQSDHVQHVVQQLAAPPHKGLALHILVGAGGFSDKHDLRVRPSYAEHHVLPGVRQRAGMAVQALLPQRFPLVHSRLSFISPAGSAAMSRCPL